MRKKRQEEEDEGKRESDLSSADGSDALHLLTRLQLEGPAALHLLVPQLHGSALFGPDGRIQSNDSDADNNIHQVKVLRSSLSTGMKTESRFILQQPEKT